MALSNLIFICIVVGIILIFIFFADARSLLKGFIGIFIKDMATTPEGAEAIYRNKIEEAQEKYNIADDALKKASGRLSMARRDMEVLLERRKTVEGECEALVKNNKLEAAQLKCEERDEILEDIRRTQEKIRVYEINEVDAKEAFEAWEKKLRNLKRESKNVVENMRTKQQIKEAYDDMDELKKTTATDKLLEDIRDKNRDLDAMVEGSRKVHDSKLSTKLSRAEAEAKKVASNDYFESLKKKYNK
ncbi:MAG: hypothetical protein IJQ28_07280 [Clostridia bacterium]|nr:hypothetical protein [Clostridia bacterium]